MIMNAKITHGAWFDEYKGSALLFWHDTGCDARANFLCKQEGNH